MINLLSYLQIIIDTFCLSPFPIRLETGDSGFRTAESASAMSLEEENLLEPQETKPPPVSNDEKETVEGATNLPPDDETPMEPEEQKPTAVERLRPAESDFFKDRACIELARSSWDRPKFKHYLQGCRWSPDGTCVLTVVNDDGMHIVELPNDLYDKEEIGEDRPVDVLTSAVHVKRGAHVYDYAWYPGMNSLQPETCCWIASRHHEPIHLWDAFTGQLRCSYKGYDQFDEVKSALSVHFSPDDGSTIYGGYVKSIKSFDLNVPGREKTSWSLKSTASCLTIAHSMPQTIVYGSWNRHISMLDTRSGEKVGVSKNPHNAGVTWVGFEPDREELFVSGARKDSKVCLWDIRNLTEPLRVLHRTCANNQRVQLDFSPRGHWLVSGDTRGILQVWNLREPDSDGCPKQLSFPLHHDSLNGVSFHPTAPILATSTGQEHFTLPASANDNDDDDDTDQSTTSATPPKIENSLTLWWIGKTLLSDG
ncbi:telomerase Cajal body protein 1 homolog isoform X2 [Anopheles aquasalis]|uniref:telomerase Cajal body protein 1 homolog isoform X2 n=1 Tax=Anopheles aquasalis TaxID=42839 RepID=UPI00215A53EF|nr:telomerase Cajal body protein 1 homolog isoform X2 [Anopheles aquasalis]